MAYISQEKKAQIAALLKEELKPYKGKIKYSLSIRHHQVLTLTISESSFNLLEGIDAYDRGYVEVSRHWLDQSFEGEALKLMKTIFKCLNDGNWDRSDSMTDYFDVGWYAYVHLGRWNKPFVCTTAQAQAA